MNDTKWLEIRSAMIALGPAGPSHWRFKDLEKDRVGRWDFGWHYQFYGDGKFDWIEWCEIQCKTPEVRKAVLEALRHIHVPGEETDDGARFFGCVEPGSAVDYI